MQLLNRINVFGNLNDEAEFLLLRAEIAYARGCNKKDTLFIYDLLMLLNNSRFAAWRIRGNNEYETQKQLKKSDTRVKEMNAYKERRQRDIQNRKRSIKNDNTLTSTKRRVYDAGVVENPPTTETGEERARGTTQLAERHEEQQRVNQQLELLQQRINQQLELLERLKTQRVNQQKLNGESG